MKRLLLLMFFLGLSYNLLHAQCSGCTISISASSSASYTLTATDVLCITGGTFTGTIAAFPAGAKICVSGNAIFNPASFTANPGGNLIINAGSTSTLPAFTTASGFRIDNYGTVICSGTVTLSGVTTINNYVGCTMTITPAFTLATTGSSITNNGTLNFSASLTANESTNVYNYGYINVATTFTNSTNFLNYGKLTVTGDILFQKKVTSVEPIFKNYCTVITDGNITNNSTKTQNLGYLFVDAAGKTFTNAAAAIYYQNSAGVTKGINFTNNGSVTGIGNYYFSTTTQNNAGSSFGADALGINFYDFSPTGAQVMDVQTVAPNASVKKLPFTPPARTNMSTACALAGTVAPVAVNDFFTTYQNQPVSGNILINDIDPNNNLLQLNSTLIGNAVHGTPVIQSNGDFTYTPTAGYFGTDLFVYQVCNTTIPQKCSVGSVEITINKTAVPTPACDPVAVTSATLTTQPNTYFPVSGAVSAPAGSTSIVLGAYNAAGASTIISAGDKLLVIQMQGADINFTNTDAYGDGISGGFANGVLYNSNFSAGFYEFVIATNSVTTAGGTVTLASPLVNSYVNSDYVAGSNGQRRFQVIRVPQFTNLTMGANLTVPAWNGASGGVLVLNVSGTMDFAGYTISAKGQGFRGGVGVKLTGNGTGATTDFLTLSSNLANASKAEGIAGTPWSVNNAFEGYPGGSFSQGAPGNAGGGGTDSDPVTNSMNTGGGGGANGGAGGKGGNAWSTALPSGGEPGAVFYPASPLRLIMGGGGGAGSINNGTAANSSGAAGGGIVMLYANTVSSLTSGTIDVSGADAGNLATNDASGGGGGGGSVILMANSSISSVTVLAKGGIGGSNTGGGGNPPHGPGGGGGGGVIFTSSSINASSSVSGGACGLTGGAIGSGTTVYGSVKGDDGIIKSSVKKQELTSGSQGCYNYIVVGNDNNITNKNIAVSGDVMKNDFDVEGDVISFSGFYDAATATYKTSGSIALQGTDLTGTTISNAGSLSINANGTYTFTPAAGFAGYANVYYKVQDNNHYPAISTARLTIQVTSECDTPNDILPLNDHAVTYMNIATTGNVTTNDIDPQGDIVKFNGFQNPANSSQYVTSGTLKLDGTDRFGESFSYAGDFVMSANGSYTFTPVANFAGSVEMNYKVCDNNSSPVCKVANLKIDVEPGGATNRLPYNGDNGAFTTINQPISGSTLLANAGDADVSDVLSITTTPVVAPQHGGVSINSNGTYTYTPTAGYSGSDYFVFEVKDNKATPGKSQGTVYLTILKYKPVITGQPADQNICPTGTALFSVTATGTGISYQWRKNGVNLSNGGTISGVTSSSLSITGVAVSDAGSYDCVVTGYCSTISSNAATLTVGGAPVSISVQPADIVVCTGSDGSFSTEAIGSGLSYQWQVSSNGGSTWTNLTNSGLYSNVTASTMNITGAPIGYDGYKYRCIVSSSCAAPATTNTASLAVNTLIISFISQPSDTFACSESNTSLMVAAIGSSLSYQWQLSTNNGGTWNNVTPGVTYANETTSVLSISNITQGMNGYRYRCLVSSACAPTASSNAAVLTVNARPTITNTIDGIRCGTGSIAIQATASTGTLNWYASFTGGSSLGTGTTFNTPSVSSNTYFYVDASNVLCVSLARSAVLAAISGSSPVITIQPSSVTTCANGNASFSTVVTGSVSAYQWQVSTNSGTSWTDLNTTGTISGVNTSSLSVSSVPSSANNYQYRCVITDVCGNDQMTNAATLTVNAQPAVVLNPSGITVCTASPVSFAVTASGGGLSYQWQENGSNLSNGGVYSGVNTSTLAISSSTGLTGKTYRVIISNACGTSVTSSSATLTVSTTVLAVTNPTAATVCSGLSVQFAVTATGSSPVYQWQENAVNLSNGGVYSGVNSPTLIMSNSAGLSGKQYRCVVTSTCAANSPLTTTAATLTVNAAPAVTASSPNSRCGAGTVSLAATASAGTLNWYSAMVGGPSLGTGSPFTTPAISSTTNYYVDATNAGCTTASRTAVLATVNDLPSIVDQPSNSTICEATNASFTVNASGSGLTYQWQLNTGSGWNNISNGAVYAGVNSSTLSITGATKAMNAYQYQVIVGGTCAPSVTSTAATLSVNANPAIVANPSSTSTCDGNNASFSVSATGTAINYQWQENRGSGWNNITDGGVYSGTTVNTLTITGASAAMNNYQYRAALDGACGAVVNSNAATLTVNSLPIVTGNTPATRCGTGTVSLSATATSGTINWFSALTGGSSIGSGSPFTTPSISSTTSYYAEAVNNGCPSASRMAVIATVNNVPSNSVLSGATSICNGSSANLSVSITGGTSPYSVVYNDGTGNSTVNNYTSGSAILVSPSSTKTYSIISITDANSCLGSSNTGTPVITVNAIPSAPTGAAAQSFCSANGPKVSDLSVTGSNITWYDAAPGGSVIAGTTPLVSGTTYYASQTINGCESTLRLAVTATINTSPSAPVIGTITQPTCGSPTGSVDLSGLPSSGTWTITPSLGTPVSGTGSSYTFTNLTASATTTFTVTNASSCISTSSSNAVVNAVPSEPAIPAVSGTTQPTCATPSGTIVFNTQAGVQYSVGSGYQANETFSGLVPGTFTLSVRNIADHSCITTAGSTVTINGIPSAPAIPTVASIAQPTCGTPSGTIVFTTQAGVQYSVGSGYQATETFAGLTPGFYTLTVRNIADNTCVTAAGSAATINAIPPAPSAPTATASQSFCSGNNPKISDIAISGTNIIWYDASPGGNVKASTTALVSGLTYYASQTSSGCESSSRTAVTVTVLACTGPNIADKTINIDENSANGTTVYDVNDVHGSDKDVDGNILSYSILSGNASGAFSIDAATGIITVANSTKLDYETTPSFTLIVRANNGSLTDDASITINLNNLNDTNPVAVADNYNVNEGGTLSVPAPGVLANDYDADGNSLTSVKVTNPAHGTLTLNANGSFSYIHDGSETTSDAFTYKVNDGTFDGNTTTVSITINPVNDPPVVSDVLKALNEDAILSFASVDFTSSYSDADGNALTKIIVTSLPANGTLKLSGANVAVNNEIPIANTVNLTFTPDANWNGTTSFGWNGFDGTVNALSGANVNITVNPVNDAPTVADISKVGNEDNIIPFAAADFTSAFSDIDGNALAKIKITSVPANGTLKISGVPVNSNDEISGVNLGNLTFLPDANWNGNTSFGWNGFDGTTYAVTGALVNITVNPVNDAPVVNNVVRSINEDNILFFAAADFTAEFSDIDGNSLVKIKITSLPANGTLKLGGANVNLSDEIPAANLGLLTFVPDANWNGNTSFGWNGYDGAIYALSDALVTITVNPVNDVPVVNDITKTINEDTPLPFATADFSGAFTDIDGNSMVKIKITGLPSNGMLNLSGVPVLINDEISSANLGNLTFVPDANWNGSTFFGWNGFDGTAYATLNASVNITVIAVNDAPTVSDIYKSGLTDGTITFSASDFTGAYSDVENNTLAKIKVVTLPSNGTLQLSGISVTANSEINAANLGNITFVPTSGFTGVTTFVWNGNDGSLYAVSNANVHLSISAIPNTPPVVSDLSKSVNEDNVLTFAPADFSSAYTDGESNAMTKIKITSLPANATLKLSGVDLAINDEILTASIANLTFVPNANWNGNTSFGWNGFDGTVYATLNASVNITVNAINDPPAVNNVSKSGIEDNTIPFSASDFTSEYSDLEGSAMTKIKISSLPLNGILNLSGSSVSINDEISTANLDNLAFVPDANWNGSTSFSWNGFDGTIYANSDALVNITVSAVNDAPVVSDIAKSVNEDNALAFLTADFTTAFTDVDGNSMAKIKITSLPANGTLKLSGTVVNINDEIPAANLGNLTFVPDANWNGNTSFGWNGQDGTIYALTDADVNILVNPLNDPPVVSDITLNVNEDNILTFAPINFTSSYTDIDGNPLSRIKITSLPANGTLKLSGAAVGITDEVSVANLTNLTFVPDANWNGNTSFGWNGYDGTVYAVSDASVIITVNAVNDPPLVTDFSKIINEDHPLVFAAADFTDAFTDIDGNSLVKIKITSLPVNGTLTLSGIDVGLNDEILVSDLDNLVFVPHANWNGNTSFGWNGFDGTSYAASNANVNITVNAVNDPPFVSNIYKSALTNTTVTFAATDFSTAFTDIENDILTKIKVVSLPLNGILKLSGVPVTAGDELNAAALGNLTFDPAMDWNGSTSFAWNGYDGAAYALLTADADISISATPNTPPVVSDISKSIHEDNTLTFAPSDFAGSFTDGEGNVIAKVKITSLPANGTLKYSGVDVIMNEEISIVTAGNLSFVPDANWNGNTSFRWNGFDGMVYANSDANVNITVIAVNDPPVVSDIAKTILEDNTLTFAAADFTDGFSDVDANSLVKIKITSLPANGKLLLSGADISINDEISIANLGNLTFIPDANWNGNTSFGWNGFDGAVYATLDANVNISIEAVNDAPIVSDVIKSINEDNVLSFGSIDFTTAFSDVDGDALSRVKIISLPANGTLKLSGVTVNPNDEVLTANLNNLTFTPDANWNGNTSFGWNGSDGSVYATLPANVTITVIPVNDPPTVSDIYKSSLTNVTLSFTTADFTTGYSDIENDAMGMVKIVTLPLNGILKLSGIPVIAGDEVNVSNLGHLTFDPATGWNGSTSFAWNANDGNSYAISDANVNITISSTPNTPPVISDISKTVNRNGVLTFALSDFSSAYHDAEGDVLTKIKITSLPANGTLKLSGIDVQINDDISGADIGNFTFVPDLNWTGTTSLTWNGLDGKVYATADASIFITVSFVNSPPVINTSPFTQTMNEDGGSTTIDIPVNTTNTDGDILTTTVVKNPAHGTVSVDGTGKLVYTPNANFNGKDTITYQVCDNGTPSLCATGIAVVTVNPVNDPPGLVSDIITQNIQANSGAKTIDLQSNITNVDGDVLTTSIAINPKHGTAGINGLGQLVYTPDANFAGNDTVTYQVCDNGTPPLCVTGKVIITVTGSINHVPVISELTKTTVENQTLSYLQTDFTSNFTDADNDVLTKILVVSLPSHGTLTLSGVNVIAGQEISAADLSNLKFIPEKDYAGEAMWSWKASDGTDYSQPSDVTITITKQEVFIPEGFSPNGDGINDYFIIKGADKYIVDLKVFNRWGNLVYESKHYQNDWDGISNSGLLISTKLPDGTYYYIVNFNNGEKETIGYITINR